jgi:Tfp pilus assembly protein PilV
MAKVRRALVPVIPEAGFGMISVLVAMVLLAVAVVALSSSSAFLVSLQSDASGRSIATSLGVGYMEEVRRRPPESLASETAVRVNASGVLDEGGAFVRTLTIEAEPSLADVLRATVEVAYPAGLGRRGTVRLETLIQRGSR